MSVTIVTSTIGTEFLKQCIASVQYQKYTNVKHVIIIDGAFYDEKVRAIVNEYKSPLIPLQIVSLPDNTGSDGRCGHHKYAAYSYLAVSDYIAFLDEDNLYSIDHIENAMKIFNKDPEVEVVYSLRKIINENGKYVAKDNFESIGNLDKVKEPFIDTSSYVMKVSTAQQFSRFWTQDFGVHKFLVTKDSKGVELDKTQHKVITIRPNDRLISHCLLNNVRCECSMEYSLVYRSYPDKPNPPEFFATSNKLTPIDPWKKKNAYLCHFSQIPTNEALSNKTNSHLWMQSWQLPLIDGIRYYYNLKNGYLEDVPSGSTVFFTCCFPDKLPMKLIMRKDITKVLIAMESPNYRHQHNFGDFLSLFDKVVTYNTQFKDSLGDKYVHALHPYNLDAVVGNTNGFVANKSTSKNICCVLENRGNREAYTVLGTKLKSLDYLRYEYASKLKIDCYGNGWKTANGITAMGYDQRHPIEISSNYMFTLIIENQNAAGGVTEKIYNSLFAGSIPLYYSEHDIPNIPSECYINISNIDPMKLMDIINNLSDADITNYRNNIAKHRAQIFSTVSVDKFGKSLYDKL